MVVQSSVMQVSTCEICTTRGNHHWEWSLTQAVVPTPFAESTRRIRGRGASCTVEERAICRAISIEEQEGAVR